MAAKKVWTICPKESIVVIRQLNKWLAGLVQLDGPFRKGAEKVQLIAVGSEYCCTTKGRGNGMDYTRPSLIARLSAFGLLSAKHVDVDALCHNVYGEQKSQQ